MSITTMVFICAARATIATFCGIKAIDAYRNSDKQVIKRWIENHKHSDYEINFVIDCIEMNHYAGQEEIRNEFREKARKYLNDKMPDCVYEYYQNLIGEDEKEEEDPLDEPIYR